MGWLYFDYYYLILVIPAMIFSLIASVGVKTAYKTQSKLRNIRGLTGADAARYVLNFYGITDVSITSIEGNLTDHYDPTSKILCLSRAVYSGDSIAAVGIACHEVGHAIQHNKGFLPIKIRMALVPVCNIGSKLGIPIALIGYVLGFEPLISIGLLLYALIAVFQFITLPVEFDASSRALKVIEEQGLLSDEEMPGVRKVLRAAAMTYVAALVSALANLLRLVLNFRNRK